MQFLRCGVSEAVHTWFLLLGAGLLSNLSGLMAESIDSESSVRLSPLNPRTFSGRVPIHLLPSNEISEFFEWEVDVGLATCPFTGMLVRARRGGPLSLQGEENLDDLADMPSPHCSVECECTDSGDYKCRSLCAPPPPDAEYCVPISISGECCHRYICDDELDTTFRTITDFPDPKPSPFAKNITTNLMCVPGSVLPESVCHFFFPRAFSGHRGPRGVCFGFDDIRCAWLDDNNIPGLRRLKKKKRTGRRSADQTMFFQIDKNGTVFSTNMPVKTGR